MPRHRLTLLVTLVALLAVCCGLGLHHLLHSSSARSPVPAGSATTDQVGPHSPKDRTPAKTQVEHTDGVVVRDFDLGDISLGGRGNADAFRAPVRGVLITPETETVPEAEGTPSARSTSDTSKPATSPSATGPRSDTEATPDPEAAPHAGTTHNAEAAPDPEAAPHARTAHNAEAAPDPEAAPHARTTHNAEAAPDPEAAPHASAAPYATTTPHTNTTPDAERSAAPLVIISHLRTFGCADDTFRYPCLPGVEEVRADRGMTYLGKALAAQGYAVLIPDLSPLWSGEETATPYDQVHGWRLTVERMRDELLTASSGGTTAFGAGMRGVISPSGAALIMHSRSAAVLNPVVDAWKDSPTPIRSLMTYGGDFVIPDGADPDFSPPPPADVPLLVVDGDADRDVKQAGTIWLTEHITQQRSAPAIGVRVRGYGHNYINRALSGRGFDDRVIDGGTAPDAAAHEALLTSLSSQWLDQTLRGNPGPFPTNSDAPLPETIADVPVQWLVTAPGDAVHWTAPSGKNPDGAVEAVGGGQVTLCRTYASMDPNQYPDRCPDPENGVQSIRSTTARISLSRGGGARLSIQASDVQGVHLHLAPTGSRSDQLTHTPLQVVLVMEDGSRLPLSPLGSEKALSDLRTAEDNGDYTVGTLRFSVPPQVRGRTVTGIELLGGEGERGGEGAGRRAGNSAGTGDGSSAGDADGSHDSGTADGNGAGDASGTGDSGAGDSSAGDSSAADGRRHNSIDLRGVSLIRGAS